jgi:hypothetical protein
LNLRVFPLNKRKELLFSVHLTVQFTFKPTMRRTEETQIAHSQRKSSSNEWNEMQSRPFAVVVCNTKKINKTEQFKIYCLKLSKQFSYVWNCFAIRLAWWLKTSQTTLQFSFTKSTQNYCNVNLRIEDIRVRMIVNKMKNYDACSLMYNKHSTVIKAEQEQVHR